MLYLQYPQWLSPVIIPGLPFRWYAMMYLVAFSVTYLLVRWQIKKRALPITNDQILSFFFWAIIGMLVGGRLASAFIYDTTGTYWRSPWLVFWPFNEHGQFTGFEGMSYHGAIVGIIVSLAIYAKVKKINLWVWTDLIVYAAPLGYTAGRIGNFLNGELWGRVSDAPWAMVFPNAPPLSTGKQWVLDLANSAGVPLYGNISLVNLPRHPSQLYEALLEGLVLWLIMWFIFRKRNKFPGYGVAWYLIGYGTFRFVVEYFREPDKGKGLEYVIALGPKADTEQFVSVFNLSMGQILCSLMIVAGIGAYFWFKSRAAKIPSAAHYDLEAQQIKAAKKNRVRKSAGRTER
jgi:phosphatidylglycerol:prolipoprotein diacylglycerol transferase